MIPRLGEAIKPGMRYTLRPGAYAVLLRGRDVLLTHQAEPVPEVQLPGGGIDPGESPLRALHREVREETGFSIVAPVRIGAFRRFSYMPEYDLWAEKLCHVYLGGAGLRKGEPSEPGHVAVWADIEDAIGLIANDGDRFYLSRVRDGF